MDLCNISSDNTFLKVSGFAFGICFPVYGTQLGKTPFKSSHGPKMRTRALLVFFKESNYKWLLFNDAQAVFFIADIGHNNFSIFLKSFNTIISILENSENSEKSKMREYNKVLTAKSIRLVLNHNLFTYTRVGLPSRVVMVCQKVKPYFS